METLRQLAARLNAKKQQKQNKKTPNTGIHAFDFTLKVLVFGFDIILDILVLRAGGGIRVSCNS